MLKMLISKGRLYAVGWAAATLFITVVTDTTQAQQMPCNPSIQQNQMQSSGVGYRLHRCPDRVMVQAYSARGLPNALAVRQAEIQAQQALRRICHQVLPSSRCYEQKMPGTTIYREVNYQPRPGRADVTLTHRWPPLNVPQGWRFPNGQRPFSPPPP
uniref:Uncharacterized protein n=1 Tax=Magnetococcus massalia (strain MO-1) TaxID=451514 RepID=A0A1S7LH59_MAGMO|nr:protein of unknown function [Candidatus Magnetococcus massalia]